MKKRIIIVAFFIIAIILLAGILYSLFYNEKEINNWQNQNNSFSPYIESSIYEAFNNGSEWVRVILEINKSLEQNINLVKSEILLGLSESKFKLTHNLNNSYWFAGEVSKEGLEELMNSNKIVKISKVKGGGLAENFQDSLAQQRYQKIIDEFDKGNEWVQVIVEVNSPEVREEVISSLSENEIRLVKREYPGNIFSGEVTREGLDTLIKNQDIEQINLEESLSPGE